MEGRTNGNLTTLNWRAEGGGGAGRGFRPRAAETAGVALPLNWTNPSPLRRALLSVSQLSLNLLSLSRLSSSRPSVPGSTLFVNGQCGKSGGKQRNRKAGASIISQDYLSLVILCNQRSRQSHWKFHFRGESGSARSSDSISTVVIPRSSAFV